MLWDPTHGLVWQEQVREEEDFAKKTVDGLIMGLGGYGYVNSVKAENYDKNLGDTAERPAHKGYPLLVLYDA